MTRNILILVFIFLAVILVINPNGDFPLNDDWSYGQAVKNLVGKGEYCLSNWTAMPLFTQVLWGALFSIPFGFSFLALRVSTLVISLIGLVFLTLLFQRAGEKRGRFLLLGLLTLLFNPIYLGLSCTFMTDVHFIAFSIISLYLLATGVKKKSNALLITGMAFTVLATLIRQIGLLIPLAFGFGYLTRGKPNGKKIALTAGFLLFTIAAFFVYEKWLEAHCGLPTAYHANTDRIAAAFASGLPAISVQIIKNVLVTFSYLSLFLLPLTVLIIPSAPKKRLLLFLGISIAALTAFRLAGFALPGNILSDRGIGPFTLKHSRDFASFSGSLLSKCILAAITLLGGGFLIEALFRIATRIKKNWFAMMLFSLSILYFLSICLVHQFDRYILVYVPILATLILLTTRKLKIPKWTLAVGYAIVIAYGLFSISAAHDYLLWNRTRWQATHYLTDKLSIPADKIDAGFEFNGLYTYSEEYKKEPGKSWWWVKDDTYIVSFEQLVGYTAIKEYRIRTWLPAGIRNIYILKKTLDSYRSIPLKG